MDKKTIINKIKRIINKCGTFSAGEVEQNDGQSVGIGVMGELIAMAEYFNEDGVEVEVYDTSSFSSDSIHSYKVAYEDLKKDVLQDILIICIFYEANKVL
jgi:hypothetical protein